MKNLFNTWEPKLKNQSGFTLIEILIVVILLGILATIIIPQVSVSTDDAKLNTLITNLSHMRNSIEVYYYQHNNAYPEAAVPGTNEGCNTTALAFVCQLTRYTDEDGNIANEKDATFKYGPYIKGGDLPTNPFNSVSDITIDATETDITVKASASVNTGYKFYPLTGVLMAADGTHETE